MVISTEKHHTFRVEVHLSVEYLFFSSEKKVYSSQDNNRSHDNLMGLESNHFFFGFIFQKIIQKNYQERDEMHLASE